MREVREAIIRGDHYRRGLWRGRRARGLPVPAAPSVPREFVKRCRAAAERFHPACGREFEGLIEGGGFPREAMEAYYFARLESRLGGCTMLAALPSVCAGPGPIVGRNYDWAVADLRWCELQRYLPDSGMRRIGYTHHWSGCPDILNEAGLYVAIASLPPEPVALPGVQWSILVEAVSEECETVAEAADRLGSVRHLRAMSYLLVDRSSALVVEATPGEVRVRRPVDGVIVAANCSQGGERIGPPEGGDGCRLEEPAGPGARIARPHSIERSARRVRRAQGLLDDMGAGVTVEGVADILRDHEAPICAGDHDGPDGGFWATIWSGIALPAEGRFSIAPGLPCRHRYRDFTID